jgi:NAD(P)H dehydrogenase (quinone)
LAFARSTLPNATACRVLERYDLVAKAKQPRPNPRHIGHPSLAAEESSPMPNVAVIYYSSTGNTYRLATALADGAEAAGATVRLRKVRELAPDEAIATNQGWGAHIAATQHVELATPADMEWADAYALGTPTRFGAISAQLKQFIDALGGLWQGGKLANKAASAFSGAATTHGGHEGTIQSLNNVFAHWGAIVVPPGYTNAVQFDPANGNPYGVSVSDQGGGELPAAVVAAARWQGERLARVANALVAYRDALVAEPATR